jgi:hypothetical protein
MSATDRTWCEFYDTVPGAQIPLCTSRTAGSPSRQIAPIRQLKPGYRPPDLSILVICRFNVDGTIVETPQAQAPVSPRSAIAETAKALDWSFFDTGGCAQNSHR